MKSWRVIIFSTVGLVALAIDQLSKYLIMQKLSLSGEFYAVGNIFRIHFYPNSGVAFGIPLKGPLLVIFLVAVFLILLGLYWRYLRSDSLVSVIALALVLGGALGNIIDRLRLGYVIDFVGLWILPVFNLADVFIIIGVLILVWRILIIDGTNRAPETISDKKDL